MIKIKAIVKQTMSKYAFIKTKFLNVVACVFLICLTYCVNAQTFYKCQIRLLSSSKQINQDSTKYFGVTKVVVDGKKIIITKNDKNQLIVSTDTVWGYKIKENGTVIRACNGGLYKVKQMNNIILYNQIDYGSEFFESIYYFSFTLDSEIYIADKSTVKKYLPITRVCCTNWLLLNCGNIL